MRSMTRSRAALVLVVVLALVPVSACSKKQTDNEDVRRFIDATSHLARRYIYTDKTKDRTVVVQGLVEDDFRYKTKVIQDGADVLDAVVSDDDVAVRFADPGRLGDWVDRAVVSAVDQATDLQGIGVFDALRARRWVFDAGGAPVVVHSAADRERLGDDPLLDARTALAYVRSVAAADGLTPMVKYSAEAISPTYRADEDPFPVPGKGSGVDRYDLKQPDLPSAAQAVSGEQAVLPSVVNFRKMAVYVKDGRVIQVRELIGLSPRMLDDFRRYMVQLIDTTAPRDVRKSFNALIGPLKGDELGAALLQGLNAVLDLAGDPLIRFRTMTLELRDLGARDLRVEMPAPAIKGSLAVLKHLGRKPQVDESSDTGTGAGTGTARPAGSTTTTTASVGSAAGDASG